MEGQNRYIKMKGKSEKSRKKKKTSKEDIPIFFATFNCMIITISTVPNYLSGFPSSHKQHF